MTGDEGATWHGITLGESTVDELFEHFEVNDPEGVERESGAQSYRLIDGINLYTVDVCTQDSTIIALSVSMIDAEAVFLDEFVMAYGMPDAVAYSFGAYSRVIFWFEKGVAVEAYAGIDSPFFGRVGPIVLFPPQPIEGYKERWPYNRTWPVWIPPHEERDDLSDVLNPFDFEAMLETSTPTLVPTATGIPEPPQTLEEVLKLLQPDETCQLPCFWGFRPDSTTGDEILSFVQRQDEFPGLDSFDIDYYFESYREPKVAIIFRVENNLLKAVEITITPEEWLPAGTFELAELFKKMPSQPDNIYIMLTTGVNGVVIMPVFADAGIVANYWLHLNYPGEVLDYQARTPLYLCPTFDSDNEIFDESVRLWLQNDIGQAFLERYTEIEQGASNRYWPVERMTGLTIAEFVEQVTEHPDECIELPSMPELREQGYEF